MGISNHILNGLILQVSRIHATVWDRITTVWIVEQYFFVGASNLFEHPAGEDIYSGKGSSCGVCIFSGSAASMEADDNSDTLEIMGFQYGFWSAVVLRKAKDEHLSTFWPGGFCQLGAWLRRFARCSLRERDSWSLSGSPRLVFSAQLCRFGRVDIIWLCRLSVVFLAWIVKYMVLMFSNQDKRSVGF